MKIYISGPITGTEDYLARFAEAAEHIREQGNIPYNPASVNSMMPPESTYEEYMAIAMAMLDMCDAVQLLPGWERSIGANREYGYALGRDMIILMPDKGGLSHDRKNM